MVLDQQTIKNRLKLCNVCTHASNNVCLLYKSQHPERDCFISQGAMMDKAECPKHAWLKEYSAVWPFLERRGLSSLTKSLELAEKNLDAYNIYVVGDDTGVAPTIPSPRNSVGPTAKWFDLSIKMQRVIDSPNITDNFLWMYDDTFILKPTTVAQLSVPRYSPNPPDKISGLWHDMYHKTLKLTKNKFNFSTHYPVVYNKQLLQQVLDDYEPPYLIESLYQNLYATQPQLIDESFQFIRNCKEFTIEPTTTVLNVKYYTPEVQAALASY